MPAGYISDLHAALRGVFGFTGFLPGQLEVIERVMAGQNVLAVLPTGAGKSLCYQLPAHLLPGCTIVVSPLIALMKDQVDGLPPALGSIATVINMTVDGQEIDRRLGDIAAGRLRLVYAAPERLRNLSFLHAVARGKPSLFVVDEAHCVSLWGHDFRPDYAALHTAVNVLGRPRLLALTATATPATALEIGKSLGVKLDTQFYGVCRPNLQLSVERHAHLESKYAALLDMCNTQHGRGLVYVSSRLRAEQLARRLRANGIEAAFYHAGMEPEERSAVHGRYHAGALRVMVATVAFGLGIDIPDVRFLVHFDAPACLESYAQEAGRAGRDGLPSRCVLYTVPTDEAHLHRRMAIDRVDEETCRSVYGSVCDTLDGPIGVVETDDLRRDTRLENTPVRVALAYLESAGLIRRHFDTPVAFSMRLGRRQIDSSTPQAIVRLVECTCPADGSWNDVPTATLTENLAASPESAEPFLLAAADAGYISFRGSRREPTLERLDAPAGAWPALAQRLARFYDGQERRLGAIVGYMNDSGCRHAHIARYFGQEAEGTCSACDNCLGTANGGPSRAPDRHAARARAVSPASAATPVSADEARSVVLRCVAGLPHALGTAGLIQLLRGAADSPIKASRCAHHSALAAWDAAAVHRLVTGLVQAGSLAIDESSGYRLVVLTREGARQARQST